MSPIEYLEVVKGHYHCTTCMKQVPVEAHHLRSVGMGRNRMREMIEHYSAIPVCRKCHREYHDVGQAEFEKRHKVNCFEINQDLLAKASYTYYNKEKDFG